MRDALAVLAANFYDGLGLRGQVIDALGVAGDFGDGCVSKPHGPAPVAGGDDGAEPGTVHLRLLAGALEHLRRQPF